MKEIIKWYHPLDGLLCLWKPGNIKNTYNIVLGERRKGRKMRGFCSRPCKTCAWYRPGAKRSDGWERGRNADSQTHCELFSPLCLPSWIVWELLKWKGIIIFFKYDVYSTFLKRFYLLISDRGEGRERNIHVWLPLACPPLGTWPGSQPRHVPQLGIEPATLWFSGWCSIHRATQARAAVQQYIFKRHLLIKSFSSSLPG